MSKTHQPLKFWLDAKLYMCVELFARALSVANSQNWTYKFEKLSCGASVEVAELRGSNRVEVKGSFNAKMLTCNTEYEVLFDLQMKPCAEGFSCHPVKFSLTNPKGVKTESSKNLDQLKGKGWTQVSVGKFQSPTECACETKVEFAMQETNCQLKKGLVLRGVIFRPTAKSGC